MAKLFGTLVLLSSCLFNIATAAPGNAKSTSSTSTTKVSSTSSTKTTSSATSLCTTDNYDNLVPPTDPTGTQLGLYNGLQYNQFVVSAPGEVAGVSTIQAVVPQSEPNIVFFRGVPVAASYANVTVAYPGSKYSSFALNSFYFGCIVTTAESAANLASGCSISVTGYLADGSQVGEASYTYSVFAVENQMMFKAVLPPQFIGITTAAFGVGTSAATVATTTVFVDNLSHCMV